MQPARPSVTSFRGLNLVTDPLALDPSWQVKADNVVITQAGKIQRARGYTKRITGTAITGAYATEDLGRLYIVDSGTLYQVSADYSKVALKTGLSSAAMRFAEVNGIVYYANGTDYGCLEPDGARPWGVPVPSYVTLTAGTGSLAAGTYLVCCAYQDDQGLEGGNGEVAMITVDDGSQIIISGIPQLAGYRTNVYVTMRDGTVFHQLAVGAGVSCAYNCGPDALGMELPFWLMDGPRGSLPCFWGGQMYLAEVLPNDDQTVIWASEPLHYHHFDYGSEGLLVPGTVLMLAATPDALLIGTERAVYAYDGERLTRLAPYGVVPGVHASTHGNQTYFWTLRGLCRALPFENLTQSAIYVAPGTSAAGAVMERGGQRQYVVALHQGGTAYNAR